MQDQTPSSNSPQQSETMKQNGTGLQPQSDSSTPSGSLKQGSPTQPRSEVDVANEVAEILNGVKAPPPPEEKASTEPQDLDVMSATDDMVEPEPEPVELEKVSTLKELAEKSGLDIEAIYDIEIVTPTGERATISEMKDAFSNREAIQRENVEQQARRDEQETADIAQRAFLADLAARFGEVLTPDQRAEMQRQHTERDIRERDLLASTAPELSNPQTFTAFRDDAVKLMTRYGFSPAEMQVSDHRQILMIRDMLKMHKRLGDIAKFKPKSKPPGKTATSGKPASTNSAQRANAAAASGSEADKVAAIARLMKG